MDEAGPCVSRSLAAEEDLAGTASTVRRWLLVEQPGPWGGDALSESRLPPAVASGLSALGRELGVRVLLIRRHGRDAGGARRTAFACVTTTRQRWAERVSFGDPAELLGLDWDALADGRSVGGQPIGSPLLLVCTNGRHDQCCAREGRPLAAALARVEQGAVWESSHFGGDRFAGNVVCLPDGLYYGRVGPDDAAGLAAAARERRLSMPHFRGRCTLPFALQAAEIAVRRHTGLDGVDDLRLAGRQRLDDHTVHAAFRAPDDTTHRVVVTTTREAQPRPLTCAGRPALAPRYEAQVVASAAPGQRETGPDSAA